MTTYGLRAAALASALALTPGPGDAVAGTDTAACPVQLTEGVAVGSERDGICRWRGIRYAAAPVGELRFRPPAPPPRWDGVRVLDPQREIVCPRAQPNVTESYAGPAPDSDDEDCLALTVTAPAGPGTGRPVIVFFHGGGFRSGSGFQADFDGGALAARGDAVVITVNHRLGLFGYLELGAFDERLAGSGNNGLRDQLAALRWIRDNAAAFGGNPDAITAVGQSAGAISVAAMLAGDAPERLFRGAILQSGSGYLVKSAEEASRNAREVLRTAGVAEAGALRSMSVRELLAVQRRVLARRPISGSLFFGPSVDGALVPAPVLDRLAAGSAQNVAVMIGTNADEATFFTLGSPALALAPPQLNPFLPAMPRARRNALVSAYGTRGAGRRARDRALLRMVSDQLFRLPAIRMAEAQSRHTERVSMYRFDWRPPAARLPWRDIGAAHCLELPFTFGTLGFDWVPTGRRVDRRAAGALSAQMMDAWLAFARTGVPPWEPYEPGRRATMVWGNAPRLVAAPGEEERRAWDGIALTTFAYPWPVG